LQFTLTHDDLDFIRDTCLTKPFTILMHKIGIKYLCQSNYELKNSAAEGRFLELPLLIEAFFEDLGRFSKLSVKFTPGVILPLNPKGVPGTGVLLPLLERVGVFILGVEIRIGVYDAFRALSITRLLR